jgi:hypothetical protein
MQLHPKRKSYSTQEIPSTRQAGHDPGRNQHHCAAVLRYFREELPRSASVSTLELTRDGRFGLRPPNRINDLVRGKFDGRHYDFEKTKARRGEYHWKLHEPNRPGYPKEKNQTVLSLEEQHDTAAPDSKGRFEKSFGSRPWVDDLPLFRDANR